MEQITAKVRSQLKDLPKDHLGKRLMGSDTLSPQQQKVLGDINAVMEQDYSVRRQMLLKRLDVTVQSFLWEDRAQQKESSSRDKKVKDQIQAILRERRTPLADHVRMSYYQVLAARDDLTVVEKTSGTHRPQDTVAVVKDLLMTEKVPDRGGRVLDQAGSAMPEFKKRKGDPHDPGSSKFAKTF